MRAEPKSRFDGTELCEFLPVSEVQGSCIKGKDDFSVALTILFTFKQPFRPVRDGQCGQWDQDQRRIVTFLCTDGDRDVHPRVVVEGSTHGAWILFCSD